MITIKYGSVPELVANMLYKIVKEFRQLFLSLRYTVKGGQILYNDKWRLIELVLRKCNFKDLINIYQMKPSCFTA